ncbi:MAG TPA: sialidase family protein [Kofleriaceae bacterium]|nr:sialidase family protein [Kofleriaceae bacterium]
MTAIDAPPAPVALGGGCDRDHACASGLACLGLPGGYCASTCGEGEPACSASCVDTPRDGQLCLASCRSDADCRVDEGYFCDAQWRACMIPNTASIVPRVCPAIPGIARDPAFAPPTALSTTGSAQTSPAAIVTGDGGLVAIAVQRTAERDAIMLARIDAQGRATLDQALPTTRTHAAEPRLARDARGTLYAVWLAYDVREQPEIVLSRSTDRGVTWSPPVAVHEPDAAACTRGALRADCLARPSVVVGRDPFAAGRDIVYVTYIAEGLRVRASRDGGKTFGPARIAIAAGAGELAAGTDGKLYAVGLGGSALGAFGSADRALQLAVSSDAGATFTRPQTISADMEMLPLYFATPAVALDDRRRTLWVAYVRGGRDAKWQLVIAASKDGGATWKRTRIGDDCAIHMVPELAIDPVTGRAHLAWYDSHGPRIAHAVCTPGQCKQLGRINDAPFAALSTSRRGPAMLGEYFGLVVDATRRTLHAVWVQPITEGERAPSRPFHAKAKLVP